MGTILVLSWGNMATPASEKIVEFVEIWTTPSNAIFFNKVALLRRNNMYLLKLLLDSFFRQVCFLLDITLQKKT